MPGSATCRATPPLPAPTLPVKPESGRRRWRLRARRASSRADRARHPAARGRRTRAGRDHRASGARHRPRRRCRGSRGGRSPPIMPTSTRCGEERNRSTRVWGWMRTGSPAPTSRTWSRPEGGRAPGRSSAARAVLVCDFASERRWTGRPSQGLSDPLSKLTLPQGHFSPFLRFPQNTETRLISGFPSYSGGGIRPYG